MKLFSWIILCFIITVPIYANLSAINFSTLPQDAIFQNKFKGFLNIVNYINHFSTEWNYPVSKAETLSIAIDFESEINKQKEISYDLNILHLIVMRYLYNIDAEGYSNKIEMKVNQLKTSYPNEYRTYWIYGNYLISSAQPIKGIAEFSYVINKIKDMNKLHPAFLEDYAYACLLSFMYKNGIMALETAAQLRNINISEYWMQKHFTSMLVKPDIDTNYDKKITWNLQKKNDQFMLFSHILGIAIPVEGNWNLNFSGLNDQKSYVSISPQRITAATGIDIAISVVYQFSIEDISYTDFQNNILKQLPITNKEEKSVNGIIYTVYTYEDPTTYIEMGGSKGYCITTEMNPSDQSNLNIEFPYEIGINNIEEGSVSYYALRNGFDRIEKPVRMSILLDSCNDVFNESSDFFWKLISETILE